MADRWDTLGPNLDRPDDSAIDLIRIASILVDGPVSLFQARG